MGGQHSQSKHNGHSSSNISPGFLNSHEFAYIMKEYAAEEHQHKFNPSKLADIFPPELSDRIGALIVSIINNNTIFHENTDLSHPQTFINLISKLIHMNSRECFSLLSESFLPEANISSFVPNEPWPEVDVGFYHILSFIHICSLFKCTPDSPMFRNPQHNQNLAVLLSSPHDKSTHIPFKTTNFEMNTNNHIPFLYPFFQRSWNEFLCKKSETSFNRVTDIRGLAEEFFQLFQKAAYTSVCDCIRGLVFYKLTFPVSELKSSDSFIEVLYSTNGWRGSLSTSLSKILTDEHFFVLSNTSKLLQLHRPTRLFAGWKNGTSFVNLAKQITCYPGPTVLVVLTKSGQVLGGISSSTWKDGSSSFFGDIGDATSLFTLEPKFSLMKTTGRSPQPHFLNVRNKFAPTGLGFGGDVNAFRLFISSDLKKGNCLVTDSAFEYGSLLNEKDENKVVMEETCPSNCSGIKRQTNVNMHEASLVPPQDGGWFGWGVKPFEGYQVDFEIFALEIWGYGGLEALEKQRYALDREEMLRTERRQVDKSRFVDNAFDREMLLGGTFKASDNAREGKCDDESACGN